MLDTLYKKACGYTVEEVTREYGVDENGNTRLIKQKVQSKYVPPDVTALKAYIELKNKELFEMTDEELEREKSRLLAELCRENPSQMNNKEL